MVAGSIMKKNHFLFLVFSLFFCWGSFAQNKKISVVTTIFPLYDWTRQIAGEQAESNIELTLLLNNGVDLHSFQPTVRDIAKISDCDVFIYVGGESDKWVSDALKTARNKNLKSLNLMEVMGERAKTEEVKEGMEVSKEEDEDDDELDEHIWLSLKNADFLSHAICEVLCSADSKNAEVYKKNYELYSAKLKALDFEYDNVVSSSQKKTLLVCDRFPFRYLVDDYALDYFAAFAGCSAETEASFKTVIFLADKADSLNLQNVLVIETSDKKIARTVNQSSKNKKRGILVLDSMQGVKSSELKKGVTYLSIMEKNLKVLEEALR